MNHNGLAHGLWVLVVLKSAVLIMFAFSFLKPSTPRDHHDKGKHHV